MALGNAESFAQVLISNMLDSFFKLKESHGSGVTKYDSAITFRWQTNRFNI